MKIILNKKRLIKIVNREKDIGFVPTMGSIHRGHLSLIKKSNSTCEKTLVTIFINKPQFNKKKDYQKYPRNIKRDISLLKKSGTDYLYLPTERQIYPRGKNNKLKINSFAKKLCGKFRPSHFIAVVDVIDRFIKIIKPSKIFLGEKDLQQLKIVEDFIKKRKIKTRVIKCKTIREKNGIAHSSRNNLLSLNQKTIASKIYKMITKNKKKIIINRKLIKKIKKEMYKMKVDKIDYVEVLDVNKINKPISRKKNLKIFLAYYLGTTRLIDNI